MGRRERALIPSFMIAPSDENWKYESLSDLSHLEIFLSFFLRLVFNKSRPLIFPQTGSKKQKKLKQSTVVKSSPRKYSTKSEAQRREWRQRGGRRGGEDGRKRGREGGRGVKSNGGCMKVYYQDKSIEELIHSGKHSVFWAGHSKRCDTILSYLLTQTSAPDWTAKIETTSLVDATL